MRLSQYLERRGAAAELSTKLGVSEGRVSQLKTKAGDWPAELALLAERETGGELDAAELSSIIARARQVAA